MTPQIKETVEQALGNLPKLHRTLINLVLEGNGQTVTQRAMALDERVLECFGDCSVKWKPDTVMRKVRNAVRSLRLDHGMPLCAGPGGYYFPATDEQAADYLKELEETARSRARASMVTYHKMRALFRRPIQSEFIDLLEMVLDEKELSDLPPESLRALKIENAFLRAKVARWGRPTKEQQAQRRASTPQDNLFALPV